MAKTIATLFHGRDNNFHLIRFTAASAVLLDHSFALVAQRHAAGGLIDMERLEIGRLAVDAFFIVSGFLVTRSVLTQPTLVDYAVARFLRLFPTLLVATIGIAFVLGPLVTSVSWQDYFSDPRPWLYVPLTSSLITHSLTLPGVFDTVPEAGVVDPPLWTLRYETMCYVLLALFAGHGRLATRTRAGLTLALILAAYGTPVFEMTLSAALGYGLIWFALVPAGALRRFNLIGDYSYGLYIFCFPIQQTFVMLHPATTPLGLFFCSFPAVLALAVLSWPFVEHPALSRKAWAGDCVGNLLHGVRQRLAASFGSAAGAK